MHVVGFRMECGELGLPSFRRDKGDAQGISLGDSGGRA